ANLIGFNGRNGVALATSAGTGNAILGNVIIANKGLGIDLGDDGVTLNDPDDSDTGPNNLQNFPELSDVHSISGITTISGKLTGPSNTTFRVDLFLNDAADPSGYGQGQTFLGSRSVTIGDNGVGTFTTNIPVTATFTQFVTATATDPQNNSSEFSK